MSDSLTDRVFLHIGLDDTDSVKAGCTTYIAALLVEKILGYKAEFIDYPNLIRLNPNVPWKTRGNGALCLRMTCKRGYVEEIKKAVISTVKEMSDLRSKGTDPGVAFFEGAVVPYEINQFADKTVTKIVSLEEALAIASRFGVETFGLNEKRGIIGALAAIGNSLEGDYTYEVIAYRRKENYGTKRKIDETSIFSMDRNTEPYTFNNVDEEKGRVIITPRGPDPILFGIRGEKPEILERAFAIVKVLEPIERRVIFRTNQGTDSHLRTIHSICMIQPYSSVIVNGKVSSNPEMIRGRHIIFSIEDETGTIDCAAYEPTGKLRRVVMHLRIGDRVQVYGGVRPASDMRPLTINLEKIQINELQPQTILHNPLCQKCGKRLKSMGKNQGFRCEKCGVKYHCLRKSEITTPRQIKEGLFITSPRSQRHLTKPLRRYGLEKHNAEVRLIENWHFP